MKKELLRLIEETGDKILCFYGDKTFDLKKDDSPLTLADQASHDYLVTHLPQIKNVPILSEECHVDFEQRKNWEEFWLIDPLDGTKEFIHGFDDFCINIALIQQNKPVLGLIYAPLLKEFYFAEEGRGFEYFGPGHELERDSELVVATSRFHHSELTSHFMTLNNLSKVYTIGAALKFGRMALGQIDLYPRFEGSKEWDTGAGQLILIEANGTVLDLQTRKLPTYNKSNIRNNFFMAYRNHVDINQFYYPDLA